MEASGHLILKMFQLVLHQLCLVMEYYLVFLIIRIPNNIRILAGIIRIVWTKFPKSTFWACFRPRTMYVHQIKGLNV